MDYSHIPVLRKEVVHYIEGSEHRGRGVLVDCTLGEGGHSGLILSTFKSIRVIGFDRDGSILEIARKRLGSFGSRIDFINDNFASVSQHLGAIGSGVHYFLYDFGISSYHLEKSGRGFGFGKDEPLDMRLSGEATGAYEIINTWEEKKLADMIFHYGEERWARKIAAAICSSRREKKIATTGDLAGIVLRAIPRRFHVKNIHPATRVFQAVRIAVNSELDSIKESLEDAYKFLASGGRILAISFHSLEDRIVKDTFRRLARGCTCGEEPQHCRCQGAPLVRIITRKPVRPGEDEIRENSRARSARLRVCERI